MRSLPPATRGRLLQLWQAMIPLVQGPATLDIRHEPDPDGAEAYATTPVY